MYVATLPSGRLVLCQVSIKMSSPSSDFASDHRVRVMQINEDEEAVIRVRTKFHVSLVFDKMVIEVFEKDGVVYTRQEVVDAGDDKYTEEREYDSDLETQPLDYEDQFTTPPPVVVEDPPAVIRNAGGSFDEINERHASALEMASLYNDVVDDILEEGDDYDYLMPGGTQLDIDTSAIDCYLKNLVD